MSFPTFHSTVYNQNHKNYAYSNSVGPYEINVMMEQVSKILTSLLQNLSYIYEANGVSYPVRQYYGVLMRILAPIQLISSKGWTIDHNQPYASKAMIKGNKKAQKLQENQGKQNFGSYQGEMYQQSGDNQAEQEKYNTKNFDQQQQMEQVSYQSRVKRPCQLGKSQRKICQWASKKVRRGQEVLRKDIIFYACKLAAQKGIDFRGSSGWYSRFLNRNPQMKKLMQFKKTRKDRNNQPMQHVGQSSGWKFQIKSSSSQQFESNIKEIENLMQGRRTLEEQEQQQQINKGFDDQNLNQGCFGNNGKYNIILNPNNFKNR